MNKKIAFCAAIGAALFLSACSSAEKKPQPYGDWQDANLPTVKMQQGGK
ncbi:hypothetical protein [Erwinia aphidicola]|nr:hypothetical protein [Erwinia aphidicola]